MGKKWSNLGGVKWFSGFITALMCTSLMSCGKDRKETGSHRYELACGPSDQHKLYLNPINARQVVKVRYDSRFTDAEVNEIELAISDWNNFSQDARENRVLFEAEEAPAISVASIPSNKEDCGFATSDDGYGIVLVDDDASWQALGLGKDNPAVTVRCSRDREFVTKQVILVNVKITRTADARDRFKTILKHEMGHSLGLDHSCDLNENGLGIIGCSQVSKSDHPKYYEAVMYPMIREALAGRAGVYTDLNPNDLERASCILGESG